MLLQIDNSDQLDLLYGLVRGEISYSRYYLSEHELEDDPSELDNIRMDLNDLCVLLDRLKDLKDMSVNKEG